MRDIGFCELLRRGEISRFAVQPENCAPLQATSPNGGAKLVVIEYPTIAEGASITKLVRPSPQDDETV